MTSMSLREKFSRFISDGKDTNGFDEKEYSKLLSTSPSPSLIIQIIEGLSNKKISSDLLLKISIHVATTQDHLLLTGLALRHGADSNSYYETSEKKIHILAYIYIVMSDRNSDLIKNMVSLLRMAGADPNKDLFLSDSSINVKDWLDQKYPNHNVSTELSASDKSKCSLLLDRIDNQQLIDEKYIMSAIDKHANTIIDRYFDKITNPNVAADLSVKYLNVSSFSKCLSINFIPVYPLINNILVYLKYYKDRNNDHGYNQMFKILDLAIREGSRLDPFQMSYLRSISQEDAGELVSKYKHFYWITDENNPDNKIRTLSHSVAIDPTKSRSDLLMELTKSINTNPCLFLNRIYVSKLRQKNRSAIDADMISTLPLSNGFQTNNLDSSYLDVFWHTDSNNNKWCFSCHLFDSIRETKKNPYTGMTIPSSELSLLSQQRNTVKRLGMITSDRNNDVEDISIGNNARNNLVLDNNTDEIMKSFSKLALLHGVDPEDIPKISIKYLERILSALSKDFPTIPQDLSHLESQSQSQTQNQHQTKTQTQHQTQNQHQSQQSSQTSQHVIVTFNRMCLTVIRSSPRYSVMIFESLKTALSKIK